MEEVAPHSPAVWEVASLPLSKHGGLALLAGTARELAWFSAFCLGRRFKRSKNNQTLLSALSSILP